MDINYPPITNIFAFKSGSIITDYMAGDNLEPLNSKYPSFFRDLYKEIKNTLFPRGQLEEELDE